MAAKLWPSVSGSYCLEDRSVEDVRVEGCRAEYCRAEDCRDEEYPVVDGCVEDCRVEDCFVEDARIEDDCEEEYSSLANVEVSFTHRRTLPFDVALLDVYRCVRA